MKYLTYILLLFHSFSAFAQFDWDSKTWDKESLGFACSYDGRMTRPVVRMTRFLTGRDFEKIRQALDSDLPSEQFLATFLLEKLSSKNELEIRESELKRMQEIGSSDLKVALCSGCTLWSEMPLKELFDPKTKDVIYVAAENWFDFYYKKKKGRRKSKAGV